MHFNGFPKTELYRKGLVNRRDNVHNVAGCYLTTFLHEFLDMKACSLYFQDGYH